MMLGLGLGLCTPQGGAAAFSPLSVSGIRVWYRMDLGASTSGGNLTALADQSGAGDANRNVTAAGPAIPYTASDAAYGGQATATFGGSSLLQNASDWSAAVTQPITVYAVGHATAGRIYDGDGTNRILLMNNAGNWSIYAGSAFVGSAIAASNPAVTCAVFNGASSAIYVTDSVTPAVTGSPGTLGITKLALGALHGGGGNLTGKIAEVILYAGAHDAATRATVMGYLRGRYTL
jgi:hypothetical protein